MGDERDQDERVATKTQVERLVEGVCDLLQSDLVGAYLHGSAVLGGFRPDADHAVSEIERARASR